MSRGFVSPALSASRIFSTSAAGTRVQEIKYEIIASSRILITLPYISAGASAMFIVLPQLELIFLPSRPATKPRQNDVLRFLSVMLLHLPSRKNIEPLVGPPISTSACVLTLSYPCINGYSTSRKDTRFPSVSRFLILSRAIKSETEKISACSPISLYPSFLSHAELYFSPRRAY